MNESRFDSRSQFRIRPLPFPQKESYFLDLLNIEHSFSGRMDGNICNTFVMEAEQLLINAIKLFELGYFDCAYFSLRSAIDVSTTMVFLDDMPENERESYLFAWKESQQFPMQSVIVKQLSEKGNFFAEMRKAMPEFFAGARVLSAEINKYVHKQGLNHFYVSRNHLARIDESQDDFINTFENYLKRCIGVVAVMRLAIDPFPVLLMDEEIQYRCYDSMTDPYSIDFAERYIGFPTIEKYKQTAFYLDYYNAFIKNEKKNQAVFNVIKHQYIDTSKKEDIIRQMHLLSVYDAISFLLAVSNNKVVKIYCLNGLCMYFSERNTNRTALSWSGLQFQEYAKAEDPINQTFDEAYISYVVFSDIPVWIEHNELFTKDEFIQLVKYVNHELQKYKALLNAFEEQ